MKMPFLPEIQLRLEMKVLLGALVLAVGGYFVNLSIGHPDKSVEVAVTVLGTCLAAWAGGWAAFSAERGTREEAERKSRISAGNKALFTVVTMFNAFDNLRKYYIDADNHRQDPGRALLMNSPQPGMMQAIHFDFDSISFFLDQDGDVCAQSLAYQRRPPGSAGEAVDV